MNAHILRWLEEQSKDASPEQLEEIIARMTIECKITVYESLQNSWNARINVGPARPWFLQ